MKEDLQKALLQNGVFTHSKERGAQEHFENSLVFHVDFFFLLSPGPFC